MKIFFTVTEMQVLEFLASRRYEITSSRGKEMIQSNQRPFQIVLDGVWGEYAVAKMLNLNFDLNCDYRKFEADLISSKGKTIDVKSTNKEGGNLNAVGLSRTKPADVFVLCQIHHDHVNVIGWVDRNSFLVDDNIYDIGNGPFYSLPQKDLNEFKPKKTL